jgi:glycerol-3-phosphate dehydrogenase subunit B
MRNHFDLIVAGAGIAGITSAAAAAGRGLKVALVSTGPGSFVLGAGCVEVQSMELGMPSLDESMSFFRSLTDIAGCPFRGGPTEIRFIPTILGSFQTVSLAPSTMWSGDPEAAAQVAVVGIKGLSSFDCNFVAERLAYHAAAMGRGSTYIAREIELPLEEGTVAGTLQFGNRFDRDLHFRQALRDALKPIAAKASLIILPGILGLHSGVEQIETLEKEIGCKLCELPTLPPSIPGMRLFNRLEAHLRRIGVEVFTGFPIQKLQIENGRCRSVLLDTPARPLELSADAVILATGPFSSRLLGSHFGVNSDLRPVDAAGALIANNLYAAGAILRSTSSARGGNAMAILTGYAVGMLVAGAGVQYAQG